ARLATEACTKPSPPPSSTTQRPTRGRRPGTCLPRDGHTATLLASGKVLVTGGEPNSDGSTSLRSADLYDPATNSWSPAADMSAGRYGHTATLMTNGEVLVTGGIDLHTLTILGSAEVYNPPSDSWTAA